MTTKVQGKGKKSEASVIFSFISGGVTAILFLSAEMRSPLRGGSTRGYSRMNCVRVLANVMYSSPCTRSPMLPRRVYC